MYQVYGIRCKENGKIYIGCTKNRLQERFAQHFLELKHGSKTMYKPGGRVMSPWQEDFNKYGFEAFELYLIEDNISDEDHLDREQYWIYEYKSHDERFGYNIHVRTGRREFKYATGLPPKPFTSEEVAI